SLTLSCLRTSAAPKPKRFCPPLVLLTQRDPAVFRPSPLSQLLTACISPNPFFTYPVGSICERSGSQAAPCTTASEQSALVGAFARGPNTAATRQIRFFAAASVWHV